MIAEETFQDIEQEYYDELLDDDEITGEEHGFMCGWLRDFEGEDSAV